MIARRNVLAGLSVLGLVPAQSWAQETDQPISIPIEIYRQKILFSVVVGGRTLTGIYDSGAARSILALAAAEAIGLDLSGSGRMGGFGGDAAAQFASGVDAIIGGATHRYARLVVVDLSSFTAPFGREVDLLVGADIFPQHIVDVDVAAGQMMFIPRAGFAPPPGAIALTLDNRENNFITTIVVNGERARANFDLGAGDPLTIGPALARRLRIVREALPTTQANGIGGAFEVGLTSVERVAMADQNFADVPVHVTDTPLPVGEANLGFPILSRFRIYIDYRRERAWLQPHAGADGSSFERDLAGLRLARAQADRLQIVHVGRGGPGAAAGLTVEDEIVAIDGARVADWPPGTDIRAWSHGIEGGRAVRLTLADGREIELTLNRYF